MVNLKNKLLVLGETLPKKSIYQFILNGLPRIYKDVLHGLLCGGRLQSQGGQGSFRTSNQHAQKTCDNCCGQLGRIESF
jgi:hypothetical protein